ncbi:MAG: hypothetical protein KDD89_07015, partial [Anaerolineales bacterium]|nr:hypothetical protein [Anaerolineales bacterium]
VAVSNYHLLRILDDRLDDELGRLKKQVAGYQYNLRHSFDEGGITHDENILREMNDFVIRVTNLEFDLRDLMEELDNPDKLIDEEWHIVLLDKLNRAFGLRAWRDSMSDRVNNLRQLVETVENTYQRLLDLKLNRTILELTLEEQRSEARDKRVGYLFGVFAVSELLGLLIGVGLDDQNPMALAYTRTLNVPLAVSHLLSVITVIFIIAILLVGVRWFVNREPRQPKADGASASPQELHATRQQQKNFLQD